MASWSVGRPRWVVSVSVGVSVGGWWWQSFELVSERRAHAEQKQAANEKRDQHVRVGGWSVGESVGQWVGGWFEFVNERRA
jgi:hypothetical protein